jgi:hypothetical protein
MARQLLDRLGLHQTLTTLHADPLTVMSVLDLSFSCATKDRVQTMQLGDAKIVYLVQDGS